MTFIPATAVMPGSGSAPVIEYPMADPDNYDEEQGALLLNNGDNEWEVCGTDPDEVGAVAVTPGGPNTTSDANVGGFSILGRAEFPRNQMQGYLVQNNVRFRAKYQGDLPATPGGSYGVTRVVDTGWVVDFNKTTNVVVRYMGGETDSPESQPYVFVTFLTAVVQQN